jgi:hypothetical protein
MLIVASSLLNHVDDVRRRHATHARTHAIVPKQSAIDWQQRSFLRGTGNHEATNSLDHLWTVAMLHVGTFKGFVMGR